MTPGAEDRVGQSRPRGRLARTLVAGSARANYEWALRRPGRPPFILVTEFPRSGANWMRDMLGDALQLPVPRFARLPVTFPALVHNHDHRVIAGHAIVYVHRDGRDVFLSHFDKTATAFLDGAPALRARLLKLHPSLAPLATVPDRDRVDLEQFYGEWTQRPMGSRVNWGRHVTPWFAAGLPNVVHLGYEAMRADPEAVLARAVARLSGRDPRPETVRFAVARNSFEAQTGRKAGETDAHSTKRQGLVGAWQSRMPAPIQARFAQDFAPALRAAGYEV